jgi:hypothetical protein
MRSGMLPSQQRALRRAFKKADAFDHFRTRTRRAFLGLGSLAAALGLGGLLVGRASVSDARAPRSDAYRELALAPLDDLRSAHLGFLAALEEAPDDRALWVGFERLAQVALSQPTETELLRRLRATLRTNAPVRGFEWLTKRLGE